MIYRANRENILLFFLECVKSFNFKEHSGQAFALFAWNQWLICSFENVMLYSTEGLALILGEDLLKNPVLLFSQD